MILYNTRSWDLVVVSREEVPSLRHRYPERSNYRRGRLGDDSCCRRELSPSSRIVARWRGFSLLGVGGASDSRYRGYHTQVGRGFISECGLKSTGDDVRARCRRCHRFTRLGRHRVRERLSRPTFDPQCTVMLAGQIVYVTYAVVYRRRRPSLK